MLNWKVLLRMCGVGWFLFNFGFSSDSVAPALDLHRWDCCHRRLFRLRSWWDVGSLRRRWLDDGSHRELGIWGRARTWQLESWMGPWWGIWIQQRLKRRIGTICIDRWGRRYVVECGRNSPSGLQNGWRRSGQLHPWVRWS